jgi:uncharacterized membrane protein (UPF0127 family)
MLYEALLGRKRFHTSVVAKPELVARGSLGVDSLPANNGMLFMLRSPQPVGVSMEGIKLDLDVAFITPDGKVDEVLMLKVGDEKRYESKSQHIQYVLQVNAGWFGKNNIEPRAELCLLVRTPLWSIVDTVELLETMKGDGIQQTKTETKAEETSSSLPLRMRPIDASEIKVTPAPPDE